MSKTANFLDKAKLSCFSARALEGLLIRMMDLYTSFLILS